MKLKYYLRGLGIGIILSVIILMIGSALNKEEISDEEIIARAQELGMVMPEDEFEDNEDRNQLVGVGEASEDNLEGIEPENSNGQQTDGNPQPDTDNQPNVENQPNTENQPEPVIVTIDIVRGEYSDAITEKLLSAGLITDVEAFNDYLIASGLDQMIEVGQHQIPMGATIEEIARILCEKVEN